MKNIPLVILCFFAFANKGPHAQELSKVNLDTLPEIIVQGFQLNRSWKDAPMSVNYISQAAFGQFANTSVVGAFNIMPGARLEERSPGSYRINIRGSSLRSPFGVRNIRMYYNDVPVTGPGGLTYLNQFGFYNFNSIEIIKGPGSSLYGQGTGGVLLVESSGGPDQAGVELVLSAGSYGMYHLFGKAAFGNAETVNDVSFQHLASNGYRNHSAMKRDVFSWNGKYNFGKKNSLKTTFLYGDLFYETPGALTLSEYRENPRRARPGNAVFPGAERANASVHQRAFIAGLSLTNTLSAHWMNKSVLYGMFTELKNPNIQNFDRNTEPHWGGRTSFQYNKVFTGGMVQVDAGIEGQQGITQVGVYKNVNGNPDSLRSNDDVNMLQSLMFIQSVVDYKSLTLTVGSSINLRRIKFKRFAPALLADVDRRFKNELAPRISIMKKFSKINVYAGVARGFSPATTSELFPSGGEINFDLQAESGTNYDVGIKGIIGKRLMMDINAFSFSVRNNIVQRRTPAGGDYYINAGRTKQLGVETYLNYQLLQPRRALPCMQLWLSHTWHNFHYSQFIQGSTNFAGKQIPAVPLHSVSAGVYVKLKTNFTANISYSFIDKIPLNDANTAYADAYHLVGMKLGYEKKVGEKVSIVLSIGADNLLNENYSLGNDANGFGGRYYNASADRNYFVTIAFKSK